MRVMKQDQETGVHDRGMTIILQAERKLKRRNKNHSITENKEHNYHEYKNIVTHFFSLFSSLYFIIAILYHLQHRLLIFMMKILTKILTEEDPLLSLIKEINDWWSILSFFNSK